MLWSLAYLVVRRLFELMVCCRSSGSKELEILVLRHELLILRLWGAKIRVPPANGRSLGVRTNYWHPAW